MQLDLLTYQPTAEEMAVPQNPPTPLAVPQNPLIPHAVVWQEAKAAFYLKLMNRFIRGSLCSQAVKRREIERLHRLRQQALLAIRENCDE